MTPLAQVVENNIVDGFKVLIWGTGEESTAEVKSKREHLKRELVDEKRELRLHRAAHRKALADWKKSDVQLRKAAAAMKKACKLAGCEAPTTVFPLVPKDTYTADAITRINEKERALRLAAVPDKNAQQGIYVRRIFQQLPDGVCELDQEAKIVTVTSPTKRCRFRLHVAQVRPAEEADTVHRFKPSRWMKQEFGTCPAHLGALNSDGDYVWRTNGHYYIFEQLGPEAAPAAGMHDIGRFIADANRETPNPPRMAQMQCAGLEVHWAFQVPAVELLKAVAAVLRVNAVESMLDLHACDGELHVEGFDPVSYKASEISAAVQQAQPLTAHVDSRVRIRGEYLAQMLSALEKKTVVTVLYQDNSAQKGGMVLLASPAGEALLMGCVK